MHRWPSDFWPLHGQGGFWQIAQKNGFIWNVDDNPLPTRGCPADTITIRCSEFFWELL